jgi:hypothetical protein
MPGPISNIYKGPPDGTEYDWLEDDLKQFEVTGINVGGFRIVVNPNIPEGEIHIRSAGKLVGKIINFT